MFSLLEVVFCAILLYFIVSFYKEESKYVQKINALEARIRYLEGKQGVVIEDANRLNEKISKKW